jgi:2-phosphoglycerate kinase
MSASGRKQKLENSEPCGVEQLAKDIFLETNMSAMPNESKRYLFLRQIRKR